MTKPWERKPRETPKSWEAFRYYRDQGITRSLSKVNKEHFEGKGGKGRQIEEWSSKYNWVERCAKWDAYKDELFLKQAIVAKLEMDAKHIARGIKMQEFGEKAIDLKDPQLIAATSAGKLIMDGAALESRGRGEPDEKIEVSGVELVVNFPEAFKKKVKNK